MGKLTYPRIPAEKLSPEVRSSNEYKNYIKLIDEYDNLPWYTSLGKRSKLESDILSAMNLLSQSEDVTQLFSPQEEIINERKSMSDKYRLMLEGMLSKQPEYKIPDSAKKYVSLMSDMAGSLGGITDASGGKKGVDLSAYSTTMQDVPMYKQAEAASPSISGIFDKPSSQRGSVIDYRMQRAIDLYLRNKGLGIPLNEPSVDKDVKPYVDRSSNLENKRQ
jgi:hypothetical protein